MTGNKFQNALDEADSLPPVPGAAQVFRGGQAPPRRAMMNIPPDAIVKREDGSFAYKRFVMTPTGMDMPADMTGDEWEEVGYVIKALDNSISWVIGDWAAKANAEWGIPYKEIADQYGYEEDTVKSYASICRAVERLIRNQPLDMAHHRLVAPMDDNQKLQLLWLDYAATRQPKKLTVKAMKYEMTFLDLKSTDQQIQWLEFALSQPGDYRLSQEPELQRPALLPPKHLPADVVEREARVSKDFNHLRSFVKGNLRLSRADVQREGRTVIEWVQRLMEAGE